MRELLFLFMGMIWNLLVFVLIFNCFLKVLMWLMADGTVIWIKSVGDNLGDAVGVCNVVYVGC